MLIALSAIATWLYALLCLANYLIAKSLPMSRGGWSLAWRIILAPVLLPLIFLSIIVKGR